MTVEDYRRTDEFNENGRRTELIRGVVLEKPKKSPAQSAIGRRLYDRLCDQLPVRFVVRQHDPLTFADSEPEPDVCVVCGTEKQFLDAHPTTAELVIEVAVSSPGLDRELASLYAEAGVKEYWIVLATQRQIEMYTRPEQGRYQEVRLVDTNETIECKSVPGIRLRVSDLFV